MKFHTNLNSYIFFCEKVRRSNSIFEFFAISFFMLKERSDPWSTLNCFGILVLIVCVVWFVGIGTINPNIEAILVGSIVLCLDSFMMWIYLLLDILVACLNCNCWLNCVFVWCRWTGLWYIHTLELPKGHVDCVYIILASQSCSG